MARPRRPAIKPFSTKCPSPWLVKLKTSRIDLYLRGICGSVALYALIIGSIDYGYWLAALLALIFTPVWVIQLLQSAQQQVTLKHLANGNWLLIKSKQPEHVIEGQLVHAGFRGSKLIIMTLQDKNSVLHRQRIWQDQLSARDFSYLHLQINYLSLAPEKRTLAAWTADLPSVSMTRHNGEQRIQ